MTSLRLLPRIAGSALIESLISLLVFSIGLLSLLALLTATIKESDNARYRSEASLLASDLVSRMWSGERSLIALRQRFDQRSDEYQQWLQRVQSALPGASTERNMPQLLINDQRQITLTLYWQAPSETERHQLVTVTQLTD
jgi:type IV pilus assembly protein PilV